MDLNLLKNFLTIEGALDNFTARNALRLFEIYPELEDEVDLFIKFKNQNVRKLHEKVKIEIGQCDNIYFVTIVNTGEKLKLEYDIEIFLKIYGTLIKTVEISKNRKDIVGDKVLTFDNYNKYYYSYMSACEHLQSLLQDYCTETVTVNTSDVYIRSLDKKCLEILLMDGLFRYLDNVNIFNVLSAFTMILFRTNAILESFLRLHVVNLATEFQKIVIDLGCSFTGPLSVLNGGYMHIQDITWRELSQFFESIGKYILNIEIYHQYETIDRAETAIIMSLIEYYCPTLKSIKIGNNNNKNVANPSQLLTLFPFLSQISEVQICNNKIKLDSLDELSIQLNTHQYSLRYMDISNGVLEIIGPTDFETILKLPHIIVLNINTSYANIPSWNFISNITIKPGESILPSLYFFKIFHDQDTDRRNSIEELFAEISTLRRTHNFKPTIKLDVSIHNYTFYSFTTPNKFYLQPNILNLKNCLFNDNERIGFFDYLTNVKSLVLDNTMLCADEILAKFKKIESVKFYNSPMLNTDQIHRVYEYYHARLLQSCIIINCPIYDDFFYVVLYNKLKDLKKRESRIVDLLLPKFTLRELKYCSNDMLAAFNKPDQWKIKIIQHNCNFEEIILVGP